MRNRHKPQSVKIQLIIILAVAGLIFAGIASSMSARHYNDITDVTAITQ